MKPTFVWDLDGTLIDSYPSIVRSVEQTYHHYGWKFDREAVQSFILRYSVQELFEREAKRYLVCLDELKEYYSSDLKKRDQELTLFPDSLSVLEWTKSIGIQNFLYTHKGKNTNTVLELLGISLYFVEVLHAQSGFERKPQPDAMLYLLEKYHLSKEAVYYIGDRKLDVVFAQNSGVRSINLTQETSSINQQIDKLSDISNLFFTKI